MQVPTKSIWMSKMFWLGVLQIIAGIAELLVEYMESPEAGIGALVSGTVTIFLRYFTKQPVTVTGKETKSVT